MWWKKHLDLTGVVAFRGTLAPSLESLSGLERAHVRISKGPGNEHSSWTAELEHPRWGKAELAAPRQRQPLPSVVTDFSPGLTPNERQVLRESAHCSLVLRVPAQRGDVLKDRKRLLHFLNAVVGDEGEAALDVMAQTVWTRPRLADELAHEAPLDIVQVHVLHVVDGEDTGAEQEAAPAWLHSHGLAEMGFVDYDVVRPARALVNEQFDVLRAIAFAIVEGATSGEIRPVLGADAVSLVPANTFMTAASKADRAARDPADHSDARVVCCDPKPPGVIARWFGAAKIRPSQLLARGMVEGRHLVHFSNQATALCAERARDTIRLFASFIQEFEDLRCTPVAKLGYRTDSGGDDQREHLWFQIHAVHDDRLDGTLINEPFDIADLRAGDRRSHAIDRLSDWAMLTPAGELTPRSLQVARMLREHRPQILEALAADGSTAQS